MFGFHRPRMYRSISGCCICRAKSSSSRFTDSKRYETHFKTCFGLCEVRCGDICNACVLLVKRWKKLPAGSKKNWSHVVDAKAGSSMKSTLRMKKMRKKKKKLQSSRMKRSNSDAHSSTSSASPAQSPSYSNQSDDGSEAELSAGSAPSPAFSFLDPAYWKRQKVCCGVVYRGRYGEVIISPHLYKPCCWRRPHLHQEEEQLEEEEHQEEEQLEEEQLEEEEQEEEQEQQQQEEEQQQEEQQQQDIGEMDQ